MDDAALEQRHLAAEALDLRGRNGVEVLVPDRDVGALSDLDRPDVLLEEHLARRPDRVRAESRADVDSLVLSVGVGSVNTEQGLAGHRRPDPVASGERRDAEVGAAGPADAALQVRAEGVE